ncbi:MAG TPA: GAF domain-containing protein, partial [Propionibacteriaceae bacterium]|nr:GAF domain-containing protein [Propionibacteriaceae bacterium]
MQSGQAGGAQGAGKRAPATGLPIDQLMKELVSRASEVVDLQDRLQGLLHATRLITSELSIDGVLERIVDVARRTVDAEYAALGVIADDGTLDRFIHAGMDPDIVAAIGHLPEGRGLLGALISDPSPIRLRSIADDPRSIGFPANHPPMDSFLGVPIGGRDGIFGNLYLTNRLGDEFTAEDEEVVRALAATASVAIENARLYEESRRRQRWLTASLDVSRMLLAQMTDDRDTLTHIATSVRQLADADVVSIVLPSSEPDQLRVAAASGEGERELSGLLYPASGSLAARAMTEGHGTIVHQDELEDGQFVHFRHIVSTGPLMTVPLTGEGMPRGAIVAARRPGRPGFTPADLVLAESFANQAAVALELFDGRADQQRLTMLEDRDRIARDLHDHVIQRLFATALSLQASTSTMANGDARARLSRAVDDIDDTIKQIRSTIFDLRDNAEPGLMRQVAVDLVKEFSPLLGFTPTLRLVGPVDVAVGASLLGDAEAVLREALANV